MITSAMGRRARAAGVTVAAVAAVLVACEPLDPVGNTGDTTVDVRLTASAARLLRSAFVDIGAVELVARGPDSTVTVLSTDGTANPVDLTRIVPVARPQLARVRAVRGPSAAQTAIRLNLDIAGEVDDSVGVELLPGLTTFMIDIDAVESFVVWQDPAIETTIDSVTFSPAVRVVLPEESGSVSGTVSAASDATNANLPVIARAIDQTLVQPFQTRSGSAVTDSDGAYTIDFLPPGQYAVSVAPEGSDTVDPVAVGVTLGTGQDTTGVDFQVTGGS